MSVSPHKDYNTHINIINAADESGFSLKPVNVNDVTATLSHFSSQAMGVDGVPHGVIVKFIPTLGEYLDSLFNTSLSSGIYPSLWKEALAVLLKQRAIPLAATDFRPVALLCFLSTVFEKLVHEQMFEYLATNKLLDLYQTGFRPHSSTQTALIKLMDDIRTGINNKTKNRSSAVQLF